MALFAIPEQPIPILRQETVVDLQPTSRFPGHAGADTAVVSTSIWVAPAEAGTVGFLAPGRHEGNTWATATTPQAGPPKAAPGPALTWGHQVTADHPDYATHVARLRSLAKETGSTRATVDRLIDRTERIHRLELALERGPQLVRFGARLRVPRADDGLHRLWEVVPGAGTKLVEGGDFTVIVLLPPPFHGTPDLPAWEVELKEFTAKPKPKVLGQTGRGTLGGRIAVVWSWSRDPCLIIGYLP